MKKKIIIIGGGFAGLNVARKIKSKNCEVLLLDKKKIFYYLKILNRDTLEFLPIIQPEN